MVAIGRKSSEEFQGRPGGQGQGRWIQSSRRQEVGDFIVSSLVNRASGIPGVTLVSNFWKPGGNREMSGNSTKVRGKGPESGKGQGIWVVRGQGICVVREI